MYTVTMVDDQSQPSCMQSVVEIRMEVGESASRRKNVLSDKQVRFHLYACSRLIVVIHSTWSS